MAAERLLGNKQLLCCFGKIQFFRRNKKIFQIFKCQARFSFQEYAQEIAYIYLKTLAFYLTYQKLYENRPVTVKAEIAILIHNITSASVSIISPSTKCLPKKAVNPLRRRRLTAFHILGRLPDVYQFYFLTLKVLGLTDFLHTFATFYRRVTPLARG